MAGRCASTSRARGATRRARCRRPSSKPSSPTLPTRTLTADGRCARSWMQCERWVMVSARATSRACSAALIFSPPQFRISAEAVPPLASHRELDVVPEPSPTGMRVIRNGTHAQRTGLRTDEHFGLPGPGCVPLDGGRSIRTAVPARWSRSPRNAGQDDDHVRSGVRRGASRRPRSTCSGGDTATSPRDTGCGRRYRPRRSPHE